MAAAFFRHPSRQLRLIGVTGTNGKTTSTYLLEAVLRAHGLTPGVIGTVTYRYAGHERPADQTTPAAEDIQRLLREMVDVGVSDCAMEVSSHALAQHRVWACQFAAALFTNLTQDHLDYHADMVAYYAAKARLFTTYQPGVAVLNCDDPAGQQLIRRNACSGHHVRVFAGVRRRRRAPGDGCRRDRSHGAYRAPICHRAFATRRSP